MSLNTEEFLQTTSTEVLDDKLDPCPEGEWTALAGAPSVASFEYRNGERAGETGYRMVIKWDIQDQEPKDMLDRETVTVTQSILLDLTPDGNGLDFGKGKNIGLGQLRTALNQNNPGEQWSPRMIEGQVAKLRIKADTYQDRVTAQVAGVTAAS